jgi:Ca2+-binding EF-hand superfamily protein
LTRSTFLGAATLLLLGGTVLAAPPRGGTIGLSGQAVSIAPAGRVNRSVPYARPRAGAFITALTPDSRAAIPPTVAHSAAVKIADAQEVVIYAPHRPVRVHLSVKHDGKSIAEMWRTRLRKAFDYFDRDKDGILNGFEVQNIFSDAGILQMLQNGFYQATPNDRPTLDRLDLDGDRAISFEEFVAYYRTSTAQVFRPQQPLPENPYNKATTEALFKLMDTNGDGKLTRDEVAAIEKLIATKDADEDECLSLNELIPNVNDQRLRGRQVQVIQPNGIPYPPSSNLALKTVVTYEPGRIPGTLTQQIIKHYDKDGDFELTRAECGFDEPTFARLDRDGNGRLDGEELDEWRSGPADFAVMLSIAPRSADCVAKLLTDVKDMADRGFTAKQAESGRLIVRTGRQPIEFWAFATQIGNYRQPALKVQYRYLFQQAAGAKGYILEKDLTGPNAVRFQFLRTFFDPSDANGDGKLTSAEFDAYFDLQDSFRNVSLAVTPAVQTPTLFQLLDENRDGRLSVRELRTAWGRLIALEPGNGDVVTAAAIQPIVTLRLTHGVDRFNVNQIQFEIGYQTENQTAPTTQRGPLWFRRMDRNGDGDISRSEFLGTKAEFDAIDTDRDDLIGLAEAEAFDRKMRKPEDKKDGKKDRKVRK